MNDFLYSLIAIIIILTLLDMVQWLDIIIIIALCVPAIIAYKGDFVGW